MKKAWCVTKNDLMWTNFLPKKTALKLQATQTKADHVGNVWAAREMITNELGDKMNKIEQKPKVISKKIVGYKVVQGQVPPTNLEETKAFLEASTPPSKLEMLNHSLFIAPPIKKELKRPLRLDNEWRLKPPYAEHALYVRLNAIEHEGKKYPFEIFFNTKETDHEDELRGYPLLISVWFKEAILHSLSLSPIIENLKSCSSTKGGYLSKVPSKPKFVKSLLAEIGYVIEVFNNECLAWNYSESSHERPPTDEEKQATFGWETNFQSTEELVKTLTKVNFPCPECGEEQKLLDGCWTCPQGHSKCG